MFFRKSLFGRGESRQDKQAKKSSRRRSWFGRRQGLNVEPLEDRRLLAVSYVVPDLPTPGNQSFAGSLGMDFDVNTPTTITDLGVFDDNADGLSAFTIITPLSVRLYNRDTQLQVGPTVNFDALSPGTLLDSSRFKAIAPILLPAGFHGTIVASGFSAFDQNGNTLGAATTPGVLPFPWTTNSGGGALSFVGSSRSDAAPGVFPATVETGPVNRFAAGTFQFVAPVIVNGTGGNDTLVITATGSDSGSYSLNGSPAVPFAGIPRFEFNGLGGNDLMQINNPAGGLFAPVDGIFYNGGGEPGDRLENLGGAAISGQYTPGNAVDAGLIVHTGAAVTQTITFTGLAPALDTVAAATFTVNGTPADNAINYTQGSVVANGLVTIDNFESMEFSNKVTLTLNGLAGDDTVNLNNPNTPTALTGITVNGGDPGGSDKLVFNSAVGVLQAIDYQPTAQGAGTLTGVGVSLGTLPDVLFTQIEDLTLVGQQVEGDEFPIDGTAGNDQFEFTSGATRDIAHFTGTMNLGGLGFPMVPVTMIGINQLTDLDVDQFVVGGSDAFIYNGTAGDDNISVFQSGGDVDLQNVVNGQTFTLLQFHPSITSLRVRGLDGDDTFTHDGAIAIDVDYEGGDPSASDALFITTSGTQSLTIQPNANPTMQDVTGLGDDLTVSGVELIHVTGLGGDDTLTVDAGPGDNAVRVAGGIDADTITSDSLPTIEFQDLDTFTVNSTNVDVTTFATTGLREATDYFWSGSFLGTLVVEGAGDVFASPDVFRIFNGNLGGGVAVTQTRVALPPVTVAARNIPGSFILNTLSGDDAITVDVAAASGGFVFPPIVIDGGIGNDSIAISGVPGAAPDETIYTVGPAIGAGTIRYESAGNSRLMEIDFVNVEPVVDTVPGATLTINATNADNAINYSQGTVAANGLVSVDDQETYEFSNKVNLVINALAGDDVINLNNPNTPTALTSITVNGGDPTASDTVIVNGTTAANAISVTGFTRDGATVTGAQPVSVTVTTAEHLTIVGQGGDDTLTVTSPDNGAEITFTPGATVDAGSITQFGFDAGTSLLPLSYTTLGDGGSLTFDVDGGGRESGLDIRGTDNDDQFDVTATATGTVQISKPTFGIDVTLPINTTGVVFLRLLGQNGDDIFNIPGDHPIPLGINVQGGNPSASDVVNFTGSGVGAVTVDFGAATVTEAGFGSVILSGVELLNVVANNNLLINTTNGDDVLTVTPTLAGGITASLTSAAATETPPVVNASAIGTFNVNTLAGSDTLEVIYTEFGETITVTGLAVTRVGLEDVNYVNVVNLRVFAQAGDDIINVTPALGTTIFVDGGDPIGDTSGDEIILNPPGAFTIEPGPESDEGGLVPTGAQRVSWDHIEEVTVNGGGPALILGTNGDDDITVIARDVSTHALADGVQDFTVTVNDTLNLLFINQPSLFIDALAGDDDIVVRAPAPNGVDWDVDITVTGGPPASATTDQGDTLEFETPGTNTVIFTALGPETATFVLDQAVNDSTINMVALFNFDPAGINYISSPGGVENVVYDGVVAFGADNFTINGQFNDTTNFDVASLAGTFRSLLSPDLDFSLVGTLTVNAGIGPFDVVNITGSEGDDIVTSTATTINVNTPGAIGVVTLGAGIDLVTLSMLAGNDNVDLDLNVAGLRKSVDVGAGNDTVNMAGTIDADIFGGIGDDILIGSPVADNIFGGPGNDVLIGGGGNDNQYGEEGQDTFGNPNLAPNGIADDPGNDNNFGGPGFDNFVWEPGDGADSNNGGEDGADIFRGFGDAAANLIDVRQGGTPTHLNISIDGVVIDNHGVEDIVLSTLAGGDVVTVQDIFATEVVSLNVDVGAADAAIDSVTVQGRNVADNMLLSLVGGQLRLQGLRYNVNVTNAAATDLLAINGNDGDDLITATAGTSSAVLLTLAGGAGNDTLNASATTVTGVSLEGDAGDDTLLGGSGNDSLRGESGAIFGNDTFVGNGGTDAVGAGGGLIGDRILVPGTPGNDVITLALNLVGHLLVTINGVTTTYTDFGGGPITGSGVDLIAVVGGEGGDRVTVDSTNGAIPIPIEYDGGSGSDSLTLTGGVATSDVYSPGPNPGQGTSTIVIGAVTQLVTFQNIEPVVDLVAGPLVVNATPADNAINFAANVITIDNFESIAIGNKTDVTINAGSGSDTININQPAGFTGALNIDGGNPTASDTVIVNGTSGLDIVVLDQLTFDGARIVVGAGPTINITTTEHLIYDGQGGADSLTYTSPALQDALIFTPGSDYSSASITGTQVSVGPFNPLLPFSYTDVGFGSLVFADAGGTRTDELFVNGTVDNDTFRVSSTGGVDLLRSSVLLFEALAITTPGINRLVLQGLEGDDTFNVPGNHPFTFGVTVEGGDPSASDVLNFAAAAPPPAAGVSLSLATSTVTQVGFGPVAFSGIEVVNVDANGQALTVTGTSGDDDLTVTVLTATSGQIEIGYAVQQNGQVAQTVGTPIINYSDLPVPGLITAVTPANALTVDLLGGEDTLVVVGNALSQTFHVNADTAAAPAGFTIPGLAASTLVVDDANNATNDGAITWLGLESLAVFGLESNDTFNVNAGPIPVFIDGGDPIGTIPGDLLVPFGAFASFPGPENDEGGFLTDAGGTISFDHIEQIVVPPPGVGACPFLIIGTNADDDITVIARDSSTHVGADGVQDFTVSVNGGPDILFLNQPDLFIDALSGDDDIVVRTRAPNGADWDMNVRIVGGPPSAPTGDQGDVVEIETPNNPAGDDAFWTPTGPETGNMVLDEGVVNGVYDAAGTDTIIQILSSFIFVCPDAVPPFIYISSPGGVELVEYDGESSTDNMTINGTALNDTTTVSPLDGPGGSGQGTFVSPASPLFNFRAFDNLTVNGGAGGFDHVIYSATEGPDVITSNATSVLLLTTTVTMDAAVDKLTVNALGGNDSVSLINLTVASGDPVINGGDGDDTLIGSPFADLIFGGRGNDILIGAGADDIIFGEDGNDQFGDPAVRDPLSNDPGNDQFHGGAGSDRFFWDPGDGDDVVEGGSGDSDQHFFFGNATPEQFFLFADVNSPSRIHLFRVQASIDIDAADIEEFNINPLGGADTVTIGRSDTGVLSDLTTTTLQVVDVSLGSDGAADNIFFEGRPLDDNLLISTSAGIQKVAGLSYDLRFDGSDAGIDRLTVSGNEGNDSIKANLGVEAVVLITLNGNDGNDFLSADAILVGGAGNDDMVGGPGNDQFFGNAGEDVMYGGGGQDTYDGGADFDTIRIPGTSGADSIDVRQSAAGILEYLVVNQFGITVEDATVASGTQDNITNVEEARVDAGNGSDTIRIAVAQVLHNDGVNGNALRMTVNGGDDQASDRLGVIDVDAADTTILRQNEDITGGTVEVGPGYEFAPFVNGDSFLTVFNGVEFVQVLADGIAPDLIAPIEVETPGLVNRLVVFKHDAYEQNNSRNNATHLGANFAINLDPKIDPGPGLFGFPADSDWFRVEAKVTGTLDFQAFFEEIATLVNGNPGLPGNGNIDIFLYDVDGTFIAGNGTGGDGIALTNFSGVNFGDNDGGNGGTGELDVDGDLFFENERIRIPAVQGQIYYLRVVGVGNAVNNYNLTVINEAAPVPYDLELNDIIFPDPVPGTVTAGVSTINFSGNGGLPAVDDFFNGKVVSFAFDTLTQALRGREATVLDYIGATKTFILSTPLPAIPVAGDTFQVESIDTGRNNEDNNTRDNTPMIVFRLDDAILLNDLPGNDVSDTPPDEVIPIQFIPGPLFGTPGFTTGFRIAIFDEGTTPGGQTVTAPQTPLGFATFAGDLNENGILDAGEAFQQGVYQFTTPILVDGSHFITARVQMIDPSNTDGAPTVPGLQPMTGFGGRSLSLEIVVDTQIPPVSFGDPARDDDGLLADSDSGVSPPNPDTIDDLITNDTTPTYWGRAEANSIIRLYADNRNTTLFPGTIIGQFDQFDVFIGQDTAIPLDGNQQEPNGYWEINSIINFNDEDFFPVIDGVRRVFITAEDVAGNVNAPDLLDTIFFDIFVDTQGPQITSVQIDGFENYDLFNPKGREANLQGPTPLIKRLEINFRDLPPRVIPFLYPALKSDTVITDHFQLIGDQNGRIAIQDVILVQDPAPIGIATAQVTLVFFSPLPDDRFTLIVTDDVLDPVGNRLDGESNAAEPQEDPRFPSGDGVPGGDFVARFTVDSRPELAVYAGIRVYVDTNGNFVYDPEGQDNDAVNRDIVYRFGSTSDALFAGKFVAPPGVAGVPVPPNPVAVGGAANRYFDQIAAYGNILGSFRWLFDFDSNGVADLVRTQGAGFQVNGAPVAGNFDGNFANGDEVGLFDGFRWHLDTNHSFTIDAGDLVVTSAITGFPQVGDVDGDAKEDLITFRNDTYFVDFGNNGYGNLDATIPLTLDGGGAGFPGVSERPTVADMNQDGIDDFGVWVPGNLGQTPREISEWFYLVSEAPPGSGNPQVTHIPGTPVVGNIPGSLWAFEVFSLTGGAARRHFEPVPFGTSLFAVFGDEPAFPIVGNFDPPASDTIGDPGEGSNGAITTNNIIVTAPGPGTQPLVKVYDRGTGDVMMEIMAYNPNFRGGVQVATGDVNGDGIIDIITAAGPGGGPQVRVFDGATGDRIRSFMAYGSNFFGGVSIATGDFNGDGKADIVTTPGRGMGPQVKIFNGVTSSLITSFFAYEQAFTGGIHVTVGDTDGNGAPEVITAPDRGGSSQVRVFNLAGQRQRQIIAYPNFTGGVWLAAGDVNGDGKDDIITGAGINGGPQVRTFNGANGNRMVSFMAYANSYRGGVRVAAGDFDGDGKADILTAPGAGTSPLVRIFDGQNAAMLANFLPYTGYTGGVFVAGQPAVGGLALHADSEGAGAESLTQADLDQVVAAAIGQLETSIGAGYGDLMRSINVRVADLPGTYLGLARRDEILIDLDAAGNGWSAGGIDLLSVVEHEFGHVLGLDHEDGDDLMSPVLSAGERRELSAVDSVFAELDLG